MKKKKIILFLGICFLGIILFGNTFSKDVAVNSGEEYDKAFYVEGSKNLFIATAKMLDQCCFYIIDVVISSVGSIFESILNN